MQKLSLISLAILAAVTLSGCSLMGTSDAPDGAAEGDFVQQEAMDGAAANEDAMMDNEGMMEDDSMMQEEYPEGMPDPAAEQKGMMEDQTDAPTGVPSN